MMTRLSIAATAAFVLAFSAAFADDAADPRSRDVLMLADWFEGEFDNEEQIWFQRDPRSATPEDQRHTRVHTMHWRVDAPQFGKHVFFVQEYTANDPGNIGRTRLVTLASDSASNSIRMRQGFFKDADAFSTAGADPASVTELNADDVTFIDGCDVFWQRVADQFKGQMVPKACKFGTGEKYRYSVHNLWLSADKYWRLDESRLVSNDSVHIGPPNSEMTKMRRSKAFTCGVIFRNEDGSSQRVDGLKTHSQGGTVNATREFDGTVFTLLLRDKEYPYYATRPDFMYFSVRKSGEQRSVAFSVHDVRSRTLGLNIPELVAFCNLNGYEFQESYDEIL